MQQRSLVDRLQLIGLAWLAMIAFDFLLHAGLLASWYVEPSPFLLPPALAFARIPVGYLSFLLLAVLLVWTLEHTGSQGWRRGSWVGLWIGALVWGSLALGLYSISTAPVPLLVGWLLGQSVELGLAGGVAGAALAGKRRGVLLLATLGLLAVCFVVTVVLQGLGLAPALRS